MPEARSFCSTSSTRKPRPGGVARDAGAVDAAADDGEVVVGHIPAAPGDLVAGRGCAGLPRGLKAQPLKSPSPFWQSNAMRGAMSRRKLTALIVVFAAFELARECGRIWRCQSRDLFAVSAPVSVLVSTPSADNPYNPPDAACIEWTDGCRVCVKPASGEATCSNPGIACTPRAVARSRR